ncbi:SCO3242 family prenyltransferase [Amycolatopsis sp. CA-230715]|uniref:SCO3242 family prenyltransferase n=1 Tax=Amycolatopsis sp. CA-230715 TaxID=2745196 RepID=UPI001C0132CA|nr:UbiA family prenyltransferase [Amycolatopsis sp. CA-230715]
MRTLAELVRAPAALTVLGDTVAGAAAAKNPLRGRNWVLPLASTAFYWAGMALNDWADRELDAVERPERPIPSGRISAEGALAVGGTLIVAGLGLAALGGGKRALKTAVPLAGAVCAYDTLLKPTPAGPIGMAACRALDTMLGAGGDIRAGRAAAAALAVHTLGVTALSTGEVRGSAPATARAALVTSRAATALAVGGSARSGWHRLASLAAGAGYAGLVGRAQAAAITDPSGPVVREATKTGIHGMVPLQAAITARGSVLEAALVAAALPLARKLSRKVSPT